MASSWIGQILAELLALQRAHEEETQCGHMVLRPCHGQLACLQQIGLIAAQMLQTKLVWRLAEVAGEIFDRAQVVADRGRQRSCGAGVPPA